MSKIEERNSRIREIADELKEKADIWSPSWEESEKPETVISVSDSEIKTSKPDKDAGKGAKAEVKTTGADEESANRGLKIMMGGKLGDRAAGALADEDDVFRHS